MAKALLAEDRQRCGDPVEDALDVHVDHLLPVLDAQLIETRDEPDAGIVGENVELAVPVTRQLHELGQVATPFHIRRCDGGIAAHFGDAFSKGLETVLSPRPEHDFGATRSEQERSRLTDPAACACDGDDFTFDCR